jgi:asparagine synthase (glutamine-hydrolysing)
MSGLAGIFKFDPRDRVNEKELMELARGIDRIGPDGGTEHITHSIGMAHRAFHTTPESHFETQPLVRNGCILTWDGRLDNREEIRAKVSHLSDEVPTDIDLVFASYQTWGARCFAELIGDWALVLWDQAKQQLILARDCFGVRRLFYRQDESSVAWCTTIEPLVLTSSRKLHLDLDYLSGCLYPRPPVETTAYQEIRSVVPASILTFGYGGKRTTKPYWFLNSQSRIRYSTDSEYDADFREVFRRAVSQRLRADRPILAELSGGIDSSSIVCMADDIRSSDSGVTVETLSYYDTDEPGGDERPYFTLVEQKRRRTGHHISASEFAHQTCNHAFSPLRDEYFAASPGYSARSLHWASTINDIQNKVGARVILSGLGGDEVLGGIQYEAPELASHLLEAKLLPFLQSTLRWSLARKKTVYRLLGDVFELISASRHPELLVASSHRSLPWALLKPVTSHEALHSFADWRHLSPVLLCMESIRYSLAQQMTCADPPLIGCVEKRYPYLDRRLFVFLASIPRTQILRSDGRRCLMRRALRQIVPDEVLSRKTKSFGFRRSVATFSNQKTSLEVLFGDTWLSDRIVVDSAALRGLLHAVEHGVPDSAAPLRAALCIEAWMRFQSNRGVLDLRHST